MYIVKKKGIQSLVRNPEQEPCWRLWRIKQMSVFERSVMEWIVFVRVMVRVSGVSIFLFIVISNKIHRQLCWYIDSMNIVFTFLYAVFCDCHHHLGSLQGSEFLDFWSSHNGVRKKGFGWRLFVRHVFKLFIYKTQTNSCYQFYALLNAYNRCVLFHVMTEGNHDLCGCVTELHGFCGR